MVICELKENKLLIPYYESNNSKELKWFSMGVGLVNEKVDNNKYTKTIIMCRYIETKGHKVHYPLSTEEYISFYKNDKKEFVMRLDGIEFGRISSKYPNRKFRKEYVSKNITKSSIISKVKHHCFSLSMYINQRVTDYEKYDSNNLYHVIAKDIH